MQCYRHVTANNKSQTDYCGLTIGALFLGWQLWAARDRSREACFAVFRQSHWFGAIVWIALVADYALR